MYKTTFFIYEKDLDGDYVNIKPYCYVLETEKHPEGTSIDNIIFQACEIESISDGIILIDITIEKDGEWVNHDEAEFKIKIVRKNELSDYIDWKKCPKAPPIYKVDKEKSKLNIII